MVVRQGESVRVDAMLLRVSEVAALLSLSRSHVYRMIQDGEIPVRRLGRTVRVERAWVDRFVSVSKNE